MPYTVDYNKSSECIYVSVDGNMDLSLFGGMAVEVGKCIKEHECGKILNDLRRAVLPESVGDIYYMPKKALDAGVCRSIKRALVVSGAFDDYKFLETVFVNQGNVVRLFNSIEDAEQWLFGDSE